MIRDGSVGKVSKSRAEISSRAEIVEVTNINDQYDLVGSDRISPRKNAVQNDKDGPSKAWGDLADNSEKRKLTIDNLIYYYKNRQEFCLRWHGYTEEADL